jgi:hypothetical protein
MEEDFGEMNLGDSFNIPVEQEGGMEVNMGTINSNA